MRSGPPELPGGVLAESPIDRALALSLTGERDAALRWAAAIVQNDPQKPSGWLMCGRLLAEANRSELAREALDLALQTAIDTGNLPLAVAACADLRTLGSDPEPLYQALATAFYRGSQRTVEGMASPPQLPAPNTLHPLPSVLSGMALLSRTTEIIRHGRKALKETAEARMEAPRFAPLPLFSELGNEALRALIEVFEVRTIPRDNVIIAEGEEGSEAYILARGELEARRTAQDNSTIVLARLTAGAIFGEMALLSRAPRAASVVTCRPSIVLVARKDALDLVTERFPDVGTVLAAHCQKRIVQNLVRTSAMLRAVPASERPALIERFVTRVFEEGEVLIRQNATDDGLHLIASGKVSVVREEAGEPLVIATLNPGDTVGEVSLVLRKPSTATVVALHPTLTLHLASSGFRDLLRKHPAILVELYDLAVSRDEETLSIVEQEPVTIDDELLV
jgi:cAMP-dependent protein kinase regulator